VVKAGPGFLRLSGNNGYDEITTVSDGILEVSNTAGSATGSGGVIVEGGAELQGDGNMDGEVLVEAGGEISPGTVDPAILGVGGLILEADSVLVIQIDGPVPGTEYSSLEVTGTVVLNQPIFRIALGPAVTAGDDFTIIDNDSGDAVAGTLKNLQEGETFHLVGIDDVGFEITYQGGDGNDVVLTSIPTVSIDDTAVAEPASGTVNAVFTVTLTEASDETITVQFSTADGTATAPADYTAENGTVTFNPGETSKIIAVTVNGDSVSEGDENFFVNLSGPTHATIVKNQGIATITSSGGGGGGAGNGGCSLNRQARSPLSLGWLLFAAPLFLARGFLKIPWSAVNSPLK
jgi:autotransporter-associated beta strand protein